MELSVKQYADLTNQSLRAVRYNITKGNLVARIGMINHKEAYLLDAAQLPPEALRNLAKEQQGSEKPEEKVTFNWLEVREKFGEQAETDILLRVKAVKKALSYEAEENTDRKKTALAKQIGISKRSLHRWVEAYQKEGIIGVVSKPIRKHLEDKQPKVQFHSMDDIAINFVKALYLRDIQPKVAWVYRQLEDAAKEHGWKIGSRATCYRIIEEIAPTEKVMALKGLKIWDQNFLHKIRREFESLLANEVWNGDTHDLDFFIESGGKPIRPQLIAWQDVRSRSIVGYVITLQGNSFRIGKALRNGVMKWGMPKIALTDHGGDYDSEYLEQVYERLDIKKTLCKPYAPSSKPIERFFETLTNNYIRFFVGYCGSDAKKNRPPNFDEKKLCDQGKLMNIDSAIKAIDKAINDYNNDVHDELKGHTPLEIMNKTELARPGKPSDRVLDILLMREGERKVHIDGVHYRNHEYWCEEMHRLRDLNVTIYCDPDDASQLVIYHEGSFVGIAENKRLRFLGANEEDLNEHLKSQKREKKRVKEAIQSYTNNTLEAAIEKRLNRGASTLEGKLSEKQSSKVTQLTDNERQSRDMDKQRKVFESKKQAEQDNELATQHLHDSAAIALSRRKLQGG